MVSTNKILLTNQKLANQFTKYFFRGLAAPINFLKFSSEKKFNEFGINYVTIFGIFGLITYPLYHLIWVLANPSGYENFPMRILASLLCIPLIFHKQWPIKIKPYLGIYWFTTIMYCLPFFFTVLLLKNNFSVAESLNILAALALLILLVDTIPLLIMLSIAIPCGYLYTNPTLNSYHFNQNYMNVLISYLSVVVVSIIFPRKKIKIIKYNPIQTDTSESGFANIKKHFYEFLKPYQVAKIRSYIPYISIRNYESLLITCNDIAEVAASAMNLLLTNSPKLFDKNTFKIFPLKYCISEVLRRYPIVDSKTKIKWSVKEDFLIYGNELLIMHVLYNLLTIPFYPRDESKKIKTLIWAEGETDFNILHIKHTTNEFMKENLLSRLNQQKNSLDPKNEKSSDLILCKTAMEALGGEIFWCSVKEHIEFILYFPLIH